MLIFDHLRMVKGDLTELRKFRRYLLGADFGSVSEATVLHEVNGCCCRREAWTATVRRIQKSLGKTPAKTLFVNADRTREQLILRLALQGV